MQNDTLTPLTPAESMSTVGGSCEELAYAVGYAVGVAVHLLEAFGSGAAEFDWATMK